MLTAVFLHGHLGRKYGRKLLLDVDSVAGAVALLKANFATFARDVIGNRYRVWVGKTNIGRDELQNSAKGQDIHIVPVIAGAGGVLRVIVGIVLVIVGVIYDPTFTTAAYGIQLIVGGVIQMITFSSPKNLVQPAMANDGTMQSYFFNGAVNTSAQGNPVPILYGRLRVGSQVINGGISSEVA